MEDETFEISKFISEFAKEEQSIQENVDKIPFNSEWIGVSVFLDNEVCFFDCVK